MLKDDAQDTGNGWCLPQGKCFPLIGGKIGNLGETGPDFTKNYDGPNHPSNNDYALNQNCLYSTTETAQQYLYGVKAMGYDQRRASAADVRFQPGNNRLK
jgi:hypothetical protein